MKIIRIATIVPYSDNNNFFFPDLVKDGKIIAQEIRTSLKSVGFPR